jgi:hypothetical protein
MSWTAPTAAAKTLTYQGPNAQGRNVRKDIANSAPGIVIENTGILRKEVVDGVTYAVTVITFKHQKQSLDGTKTVDLSATLTVRIPQAVISNVDIRQFSVDLVSLLICNGATASTGELSAEDNQLTKMLLGSY